MSSTQSPISATAGTAAPAAEDPLVVCRSEVSREMLRDGIRQLNTLQRDALRLSTREGLSVDEASARLGVDRGELEANLRSGLHVLRRSLLAQLGEIAS